MKKIIIAPKLIGSIAQSVNINNSAVAMQEGAVKQGQWQNLKVNGTKKLRKHFL